MDLILGVLAAITVMGVLWWVYCVVSAVIHPENAITYVGDFSRSGWTGTLPHYRAFCEKHGTFYINYPIGYDLLIRCPDCVEEEKLNEATKRELKKRGLQHSVMWVSSEKWT
jgi:hypothetical protein